MSDSDIISLMQELSGPAFTASEIANEVEMSKEGVYNRLQQLHEADIIGKKKPQPTTVIWWLESEEHCPLEGD